MSLTSVENDLHELSESLFKHKLTRHLYIENSVINNISGEFEGSNFIHESHLSGTIRMGVHSYINPGCRLRHVNIGRYCSIADRVLISPEQHSIKMVSSHPFMINKSSLADATLSHRATEIGNDVWIGAGSVIMPGISVGDGAVIGASSVVTRSVPPYAVFAGVPAKLLKMRFSETQSNKLQVLRWWDYSMNLVQSRNLNDIDDFVEFVQQNISDGRIEQLRVQSAIIRFARKARVDNFSCSQQSG